MNDNNLPPTNFDAEEAILGGILLDPKAIALVADILPIEAFAMNKHKQVYEAALELHANDKQIDLISISTWLSDQKLLSKAGGKTKLAQILNRTVSATNIDRYVALVLDKHQRRRLIAAGHEIIDLGYDTSTELESVFDKSEDKIFNLTTNKKDKFATAPINDCLADIVKELEEGTLPLYHTGLTDLDSLIGGLTKQDLIIVAARPSMGKSWLACYLANHIAIHEKKPVVFFSAEMSRKQLTKRFLAMHTGIDSQRLMNNVIYKEEFDSLAQGLRDLAKLPIEINDTPAEQLTPAKIRSELRKIQSKSGELGLVILDYIQKLGDRAAGNRAQAIGKYSGACKDIAKQFDVPFIVLAQINRGVESQSNKRPSMGSIKDSGDLEQDSDLLLMLYRDEYYKSDTKENGVMEIIVGKNRNGATGTCKVDFDPSIGKLVDLFNK